MSIREIQEKIKVFLQNDRLFYGLAFLLVAGISFGVGRLSVSEVPVLQKTAEIVQKSDIRPSSQVAAPAGVVEESTGAGSTTNDTPSVPKTTGAYVGSKNSTKYHLPWCSGAKRIAEANKVWFATKDDAEKAGRTPAANCPGI